MSDIDGLEIVVGDNYRESFPEVMGVLPSQALDVARKPDAREAIEVGEGVALQVNISIREPTDTNAYYLLVLDRVDEHGVRVLHDAFKFYDDICSDVESKTPLELLMSVADRFAYNVRPGGEVKKLILREGFPCAPEDVNTETMIRLMMPVNLNKGEEVLGTQYVTYDVATQTVEFAVGFVWNVTRYREYLARVT